MIILKYLILFVIIYGVFEAYSYYKALKLISLLNENLDPDLFLRKTNVILKSSSNIKFIDSTNINRSYALILKGEFGKSIDTLNKINENNLEIKFVVLYNAFLFIAYLLNDNLDKANEILDNKKHIFYTTNKIIRLDNLIILSKGIYNYKKQNYDESRRSLEELINNKLKPIDKILAEYFIGLACINTGRIEQTRECFKNVISIGEKTFMYREIINNYSKELGLDLNT